MVWDQNCTVIVALNRLVENSTIKGDLYWPNEKQRKLKFENLTVELVGKLRLKKLNITIRRLKLSYNDTQREIYHLHYEGWPDFGVPENSLSIRELVRISLFYQKQQINSSPLKGPIVVHCSAGIGRSGSFMAIASIMSNPLFNQLIKTHSQSHYDKGKLLSLIYQFKIADMVLLFRQKRHPGIVQTQQQYNFIYSALVDEICNTTTVSEGLNKLNQWHSLKIDERELLSKSGPYLKRNYLQFLNEFPSNDLFNELEENGECAQSSNLFFLRISS
jgi:protein tyrosine phosphatase